MKRPVGIVLSAIALGLVALFSLLIALGGISTSLNGPRFPAGTPVPALPPAAVLSAVLLFLTLAFFALAAWSTITLVGLLRMRFWARISALLIAVALFGLSLFFAVAAMAMNSGSALAGGALMVAALAAGWFVYLVQRRTRQAFEEARALRGNGELHPPESYADASHGARQAPPWGVPQRQRAPNPLTDFTIARPIAPQIDPDAPLPFNPPFDPRLEPRIDPRIDPHATAVPEPPHAAPYWQAQPAARQTVMRSKRPVSITILSVLALISAFLNIPGVISPLPSFVFGFVVSGWPLHLYSFVTCIALGICGLGMLRLQRPAWLLSFVLLTINSLNFLAYLLPGPRARYIAFIAAQQQALLGGQPALPANIMAATLAVGMFFGLLVMVFFAGLLWRARGAFEPAVTPPQESDSIVS